MGKNKKLDRVLTFNIPMLLMLLWSVFPIYWTLNTALKPESDIIGSSVVEYLPSNVTIDNFITAWTNVGFDTFFGNSLIVGISTVLLTVLLSILAGYALGRYDFAGKRFLMLVLLATQFIPKSMLIIPLFIIFSNLGLTSNLFGLVLIYTTVQVPFNSILMSGFIASIPAELEEAASIDGATKLQSLTKVLLPLLGPGIVATSVNIFVYAWNEFILALMLTSNHAKFTLPVGLSFMMGEYNIHYGALAAGSIIALIPSVILFLIAQKHLVNGMGGAVKG
ncbi:carbohydrate ABC transporter permease [Alkalibacterium iburiense]|uniref:Carbohydrate ABC transporter permease n=1 Tax=Alkalibacterium iburiense TaxID=290589 RepID=A0ABN0XA30_9LACT